MMTQLVVKNLVLNLVSSGQNTSFGDSKYIWIFYIHLTEPSFLQSNMHVLVYLFTDCWDI
jgi:hypothetical protein